MRLPLLLLLLSGCAGDGQAVDAGSDLAREQGDLSQGCGKDTDCKGDRICVEGKCVDVTRDMATLPDFQHPDLAAPPDLLLPDLVVLPDLFDGCRSVADCQVDGSAHPACCNGVCVDTDDDPKNCGGCGTGCGNQSCCSGFCSDTSNDLVNCGGCNMPCVGQHAMWTCMMSACAVTGCTANYNDCDKSPANGCEKNGACF
jgi:hypothetical protein